MRLIPGKTKVEIELFKGVTLPDILVGGIAAGLMILALLSSLPGRLYIMLVIALLAVGLLVRMDTVPNYIYLLHIIRHLGYDRHYLRSGENETEAKAQEAGKTAAKTGKASKAAKPSGKHADMERIMAFTDISNGMISYGGKYYGAVVEIPPVEFRFFSKMRRTNAIESGLGRVLRSINREYSANIVKIERPIRYDDYLQIEYDRLDSLKASFEQGMLSEPEYKSRIEILYDRINEVHRLCFDDKVIEPYYYLVLFESDKHQLNNQIETAMQTLRTGEMAPKRLNDKELAVFLRYTNELDFDEREIEDLDPSEYTKWTMPKSVDIKARTVELNHIITHNMRIVAYPTEVGDAWLASVMSMPGTKVVVKCRPMERAKAVRTIDRSLQELRGQYMATGVDSRRIELQNHIETLGGLLVTLQQDNESLLEVNIYVTVYDIAATRANPSIVQPPRSDRTVISNMKRTVRRYYQENSLRLNNMEFDQMQAFIGSQISGYDPMVRSSRGIPSNSMAACFPWIFAHVSDVGGIKFGSSQGVPVFIDFFRRDNERVNSNMVIVGKSGSGKSFATKSLLANLAADDCKIFILDPENEYTELAENLHGKFINVGNAQYGRLNPFQIITALDDDEVDGSSVSGSYATHLQFLEEFFRQILPDCDKDAMEYLNSLIDRMYTNCGITGETDLSRLRPEDYPIFDDLYDTVLSEFQRTDNEYIRTILRTLMNYVAKFSTGGRNANIWNGPSTITTEENFTVFNFQSLISNRNNTIGNAQMLLVLKYIDNEIIKNRDYNTKYGLNRKIVVVIDEAHVFIDTKFPVALDFMFQLAKRIRKYNGMQIVITQNIKDFVGSEEIARKSTAIINACQYSFIFSLAPNDIQDLCRLYEKAGGINEVEQEQITTAPRGQAFAVMSPMSRSTFRVDVPKDLVEMFQERGFQSRYFSGEDGAKTWEKVVGESREKYLESRLRRWGNEDEKEAELRQKEKDNEARSAVSFVEVSGEEEDAAREKVVFQETEAPKPELSQAHASRVTFAEETEEAPKKKNPFADAAESYTDGAGSFAGGAGAITELLGRFSYEALLREIQRNVESTIEERLTEIKDAAGQSQTGTDRKETASAAANGPAEQENAGQTMTEQPEQMSTGDSLGQQDFGAGTSPDAANVAGAAEPIPEDRTDTSENTTEMTAENFAENIAENHAEDSTENPAENFTEESAENSTENSAEESAGTCEENAAEHTSDGSEKPDDDMDILSFLRQDIGEIELPTPIETMEILDEKVVDITFEDLADYCRKMRKTDRKKGHSDEY